MVLIAFVLILAPALLSPVGAFGDAPPVSAIENASPVARWSVDPGSAPPTRGIPLQFRDLSYDPDGSIESYDWAFGDGADAMIREPAHTYARSGVYNVSLVVGDGERQSDVTADSHKALRVAPDHDIVVHLTATLPDGRVLDLNDGHFALSALLDGASLDLHSGQTQVALLPNGAGVDLSIDRMAWMHGAILILRLDGAQLLARAETVVVLVDDQPALQVELRPRLALVAALAVGTAENDSPVTMVIGRSPTFNGDPVYADATERPHGTGHIRWSDGPGVSGQVVRVEARYIGLGATRATRDEGLPDGSFGREVSGWCAVGLSNTNAEGAYIWALDGTSACPTYAIAEGVYGSGRWEVRAIVSIAEGWGAMSPTRTFFVDPTGGQLLVASSGLV